MTHQGFVPSLSSYGLIQEHLCHSEWLLLVSCVLLCRTTRKQLEKVFPDFVSRWPTPGDLLKADERDIAALIKPLGFSTRRTAGLLHFAAAYLGEWHDVCELPGIGEYAAAAHSIFIRGIVPATVKDHALALYVAWHRKHHKEVYNHH